MKAPSIPDDGGQTPEALQRQALAWVRLLTLGPVTPEQLHAFEAWRDASPAHQAAVQDAKRLWDALKPTTAVLAKGSPGMVLAFEQAQARRVASRRAFLGAAGATVAVAGLAVAYPPLGLWRSPAEWGADYNTAIGEQQELRLAPGVAVALNTRTSARREVVDDRLVGLDLLAGETAVDLQPGQRFTVLAGVGQSLGDAGRFEVRNLDGKVCVTCIDGTVQVRHPAASRLLGAGQQTIYDARAVSGVAQVDPDAVSAWRRGLLVFHQARLAAVIDEINRYRPGRVVLANSAQAERRVSGNFQIADPDKAIAQLQYLFDLRIRFSAAGVVILS